MTPKTWHIEHVQHGLLGTYPGDCESDAIAALADEVGDDEVVAWDWTSCVAQFRSGRAVLLVRPAATAEGAR